LLACPPAAVWGGGFLLGVRVSGCPHARARVFDACGCFQAFGEIRRTRRALPFRALLLFMIQGEERG
jgi:hypothetical protein